MPARSFDDANAVQRALRNFAATKVGAAMFRPTAHHADKLVSRLTKGRRSFAGLLTGIPTVILTTTGAKTGQPRSVAVLGVPWHDRSMGLIASNWGGTNHPAWYHNLEANPRATLSMEGETWEADARLATDEERAGIWAKGLEYYPGWRNYEERAGDRRIQAFVLTPVDAPT